MDLNRVFNQRSTFNYVLVIEWLERDDLRTGAMLLDHLDQSGVPCVSAGCETSDGLREILREALERIPQWGIPVVHIETHGQKPPDDLEQEVAFGSGEGPLLTWSELGSLLAPLNEAAGFELMLVGAACYGSAAEGAMNACDHVAPYSVCIGYETEVLDESVVNSMTELYTALIVRREGAHQAIASAQSKLRPGEKIHFLTSVIVGYQVFRWCVSDLETKFPDMPAALWEDYKRRFFKSWDVWFPPALQLRDDTFRLDWELVVAPQPLDEQLADTLASVGIPTSSQMERLRAALLADSGIQRGELDAKGKATP
jgi:hypothetical protein